MKKHTIEVRVSYADTDKMGFVYYANYLVWFEIARTELFRNIGMNYKKIEEDRGIYLPVVESFCRYKTPLRYDDIVSITASLADIGKMRLAFEYEVKRGDVLAATGTTKHVFIDKDLKPVSIPEDIREALGGECA